MKRLLSQAENKFPEEAGRTLDPRESSGLVSRSSGHNFYQACVYLPELYGVHSKAEQNSAPELSSLRASQTTLFARPRNIVWRGYTLYTDRRDYTRIAFTDESKHLEMTAGSAWEEQKKIESLVPEHHPIPFRLVLALF